MNFPHGHRILTQSDITYSLGSAAREAPVVALQITSPCNIRLRPLSAGLCLLGPPPTPAHSSPSPQNPACCSTTSRQICAWPCTEPTTQHSTTSNFHSIPCSHAQIAGEAHVCWQRLLLPRVLAASFCRYPSAAPSGLGHDSHLPCGCLLKLYRCFAGERRGT